MLDLAISCVVVPLLAAVLWSQEVATPDLRGPKSAANDIFRLEDRAMEAWRQGNPMVWAETAADEVSYLDPNLAAPVIGVEAYREYLKPLLGKVAYDASEYVEPRVARYGDLAVLTYNYHSLRRGPDGKRERTSFWNTTEVYRLAGGQWRIAHTHWSYIGHKRAAGIETTMGAGSREPRATGVTGELLALETGALERWRQGDPSGFLALASPEITGFDPESPGRLTGLAAVRAALERRSRGAVFDAAKVVNPRVQAYGGTAVLTYQMLAVVLNPDGTEKARTPWHVSEVFVQLGDAWRLVHTHWSHVKGVREGGGI